MQGTRERILDHIIKHREVRVEELAEALGITPAAVRRHLDNLRADGLVDARAVKQPTGRPFYAYHPTERATGALPAAYADLLGRMLRSLGEREDVVNAVMANVAEALAARHRGEVSTNPAPEVRAEEVTDSLRQEGILDRWHIDAEGIHLLNDACPYKKAAELSPLPCETDRQAIELLLGLNVEQLNRIVDGAPVCEYLVRAVRGPQDLIEVS